MKKILIAGAGSYIGTSFERYIQQYYPDDYHIDTVDMIGDSWRETSFAGYDSIFFVAGIAHSDSGKISKEKEQLYYSVNTELAVSAAEKSRAEGIKQFIFMSSSIVYGKSAPLGKKRVITKDTPVSPDNCYGDSKVQAENRIMQLQNDAFSVVILRPPIIYGKGCKGNYPTLAKIAKKSPFFPRVRNQRSMIYIENFCEFVRLMIANDEKGIFWPQNAKYVNTGEMVQTIAAIHQKSICITPIFNWGLYLLRPFVGLVDKAFGSFTYDMEMSCYPKGEYRRVSFEDGITETES